MTQTSETSKKEEIQQFRNQSTEADFEKLKNKVSKGEVTISMQRDKSRRLLRTTQAGYYYAFFALALLLGGMTVYLVGYGNKWYTAIMFATTLMVLIVFWRTMTRRMSIWAMKAKNNFDYAYYTSVIIVKKGEEEQEEEYEYPDAHWKDAL